MPELATLWFLLVGVLLTGYAILDGFDLGVGVLHLFVAKDDRERRVMLNAVGPVWDGNEVWLLTGGGALFAAFPAVYATVFSGMYLALMLLLAALIARAVSLEFRSKEPGARWRRFWDVAFAVGSFLPALLLGVALGNVMRGLPLSADGEFAGTFLGLLNPFSLLVGALSTAVFTLHGAVWLELKTEGELKARVRRAGDRAYTVVIALAVLAALSSRFSAPRLWIAFEAALPWLAPVLLAASLFALPRARAQGRGGLAFALSAAAIAAFMAIVGLGIHPYLVPPLDGFSTGLTVAGSASSPLTLRAMLAIALVGMPLVVAYTVFIYRRFRGPVVLDDTSY
jgi:cytochrome d ubiquinol oxidase subunit II